MLSCHHLKQLYQMSSIFDCYFIVKKKWLPWLHLFSQPILLLSFLFLNFLSSCCHAVLKISDLYAFADLTKQLLIELSGRPPIVNCTIILCAAIRAPYPSALLVIFGTTPSLVYVFRRYAETHQVVFTVLLALLQVKMVTTQ